MDKTTNQDPFQAAELLRERLIASAEAQDAAIIATKSAIQSSTKLIEMYRARKQFSGTPPRLVR